MPSGHTHDRITLWSLPLVAGLTFGQTQSGSLTLLVSGGFLFGGLMFGPDLDVYSRQYQRWGWLRWIWIPYQNSLRHRSFLSHGPVIGTALRLLYLTLWVAIVTFLGLTFATIWGVEWNWPVTLLASQQFLSQYTIECFAFVAGLELGAMSHSLSDWTGSAYKRVRKQGLSGLLEPFVKIKKRKRKPKPPTG